MSRIYKYQQSIQRFIINKSTLHKDINSQSNLNEETLNEIRKEINIKVTKSDMILPILFLTIMGNLNRKNNITIQGFYVASSIEYLIWICDYLKNNNQNNSYLKNIIIYMLSINIYKSIELNIDTLSRTLDNNKFTKIYSKIKSTINDRIKIPFINWSNIEYISNEKKKKIDLYRYFLKDKIDLKNKFDKIKIIKKNDIIKIIKNNIGYISGLSCVLGWLFGCGDIKLAEKAKQCGILFGILYTISIDFKNVKNDIENAIYNNNVTINYVVNTGFHKSYENYLDYKQQFITLCLTLDIYTSTIKEILELIDKKVDMSINNTYPDLKSDASSSYTNTISL